MLFIDNVCLFVFFRWKTLAEGVTHISSFNDVSELPAEIRFSYAKTFEFFYEQMMTWV